MSLLLYRFKTLPTHKERNLSLKQARKHTVSSATENDLTGDAAVATHGDPNLVAELLLCHALLLLALLRE